MSNTAFIAVRADGTAVTNPHLQLVPVRTDDQEISDFTAELERALEELEKAFSEKTSVDKKLQSLQQDLAGRGFWGQLRNSFNGETAKELSVMMEGLATSLGLTQSVVRVILKVQTKKSRLLRQFSDALVGKILNLQSDTHTLDHNQQHAALFFLGELQEQINEQIRQQELVDSHEFRLADHEQWQRRKEESDAALGGQVSSLQGDHTGLKQQFDTVEPKLAELAERLVRHQSRCDEHDEWRKHQDERDARLTSELSRLESEKAAMQHQIESLAARLAVLEESESKSSLPKTIFIRNLLPGLALVLASMALFWVVIR